MQVEVLVFHLSCRGSL